MKIINILSGTIRFDGVDFYPGVETEIDSATANKILSIYGKTAFKEVIETVVQPEEPITEEPVIETPKKSKKK